MCLSIPAKILTIEKDEALVSINGAQTRISLLLIDDNVIPGKYVLVHAGYALQILSEEEALEGIKIIREMNNKTMISDGSA